MDEAAASTPQCLLRRLFFLLPAALCGCISIPPSLKSAVSADGAHATETTSVGPLTLVQTASYLPGRNVASPSPSFTSVRCQSKTSDMLVFIDRELTVQDSHQVCSYFLAATDYVWTFNPLKYRVRYQLELYPKGKAITRRGLSVYPLGGRLKYAFNWGTRSASLPEIVDTLSHESLHLAAGLAELPPAKGHDEVSAYLAGACGQLEVFGTIDVTKKPFAFGASTDIPESARKSAAVAAAEWQSLPAGSRISRNTPAGQDQTAKCSASMRGFFHK